MPYVGIEAIAIGAAATERRVLKLPDPRLRDNIVCRLETRSIAAGECVLTHWEIPELARRGRDTTCVNGTQI